MDEVFFLKRLRFNAKLQLPPLYVSVLKFADQKKKTKTLTGTSYLNQVKRVAGIVLKISVVVYSCAPQAPEWQVVSPTSITSVRVILLHNGNLCAFIFFKVLC